MPNERTVVVVVVVIARVPAIGQLQGLVVGIGPALRARSVRLRPQYSGHILVSRILEESLLRAAPRTENLRKEVDNCVSTNAHATPRKYLQPHQQAIGLARPIHQIFGEAT